MTLTEHMLIDSAQALKFQSESEGKHFTFCLFPRDENV